MLTGSVKWSNGHIIYNIYLLPVILDMQKYINQSIFQVLEKTRDFSQQCQLLREEAAHLKIRNEQLSFQNKKLKLALEDRDIKISQFSAQIRELSKVSMRLSKGLMNSMQEQVKKEPSLSIQIQCQSELKKLNLEKEQIQGLLRDSAKKNQKLELQLDRANQEKILMVLEYTKTEKALKQYKRLLRTQTQKNLSLDKKVIELEAETTVLRKQQNVQTAQLRKVKSGIFNI